MQVQAAVEQAYAQRGFPAEDRRFLPHVTIARHRRGTERVEPRNPVPPVPERWFNVKTVHLMQSVLSSAGPTYTTLMKIPLIDRQTLG